jgi:hypothetical protein
MTMRVTSICDNFIFLLVDFERQGLQNDWQDLRHGRHTAFRVLNISFCWNCSFICRYSPSACQAFIKTSSVFTVTRRRGGLLGEFVVLGKLWNGNNILVPLVSHKDMRGGFDRRTVASVNRRGSALVRGRFAVLM